MAYIQRLPAAGPEPPAFDAAWAESGSILPETPLMGECQEMIRNQRERIDTIMGNEWDDRKLHGSPYEGVPAMSPIKPVSRAFFKCLELLASMQPLVPAGAAPNVVCLCEAPGGFIQAIVRQWPQALVYGYSVRAPGAPSFNRLNEFLVHHQKANVLLKYEDILNPAFLLHSPYRHHEASIDLVTADGAFDFSEDYNAQEQQVFPLLWAETCAALHALRQGGTFVIKCFDLFHRFSHEWLYILCWLFEGVSIVKPLMSRMSNSERYILCHGLHRERWLHVRDTMLFIHKSCTAAPKGMACRRLLARTSDGFEACLSEAVLQHCQKQEQCLQSMHGVSQRDTTCDETLCKQYCDTFIGSA